MIGVVIPVRNEEALLARCLDAVRRAASHPALCREEVMVVVVLDACTDRSAEIAVASGATVVTSSAGLVGAARAIGAERVIDAGARWMACTDADTVVAPDWLAAQVALEVDVVCGTIAVDDWSHHKLAVRRRYSESYIDADGHRHIHGANLGVATDAYLRAGGFKPLAFDEDVALVQAMKAMGARIAWSAAPRVRTSARLDSRARNGFGDYLRLLAVGY